MGDTKTHSIPVHEKTEAEQLIALRKRAEKAVEIIDLMNETFVNAKDENLILIIMAVIQDAYRAGIKTMTQ